MAEFFIDTKKKPELEDAILIEGLPGIGNVAKIAVDFIIDRLDAEKYGTIYSDCFPKSVFIEDDSLVSLPKVEIYYKKRGGARDLVFLIGDVQPQKTEDSYALIFKILEIAKELGVKENITLGGIGKRKPTPNKVHGAASSERMINKFKEHKILFDGNDGIINLIVGAAGLLIGLGKREGIDGISLLSETSAKPRHNGVESSRALLNVLKEYLDLEFSLDELEDQIDNKIEKKTGKRKKDLKKMLKKYSEKKDLSYIG